MKVLGFDGRYRPLKLKLTKRTRVSKLHERVRNILKSVYPFDLVYEEIALPGSKTNRHKGLYADFFIPSQSLIVEVHGRQHYEFNSYHYKTALDFGIAKLRDNDKVKWCVLNNIDYVELKYDDSDTEWERIIRNRGCEMATGQ